MRRFFDLTFRPFFVITGSITALGAVNAFWPRWAVEKILLIPFNQDYTIILQHWGFMLGLMGAFMIIAAFNAAWRYPILIFCTLEKTFVVYLVAVNWNRPYARGLWAGAAMDATVVLYTLAFFMVRGFTEPSPR
jgi:hypothetical protein